MTKQREVILARMTEVICDQLDVKPEAVHDGASFVDDLGADSLAVVELVLALEEAFGVAIPDDRAEGLRTVGDAVTYVLEHGAATARAS